MKKETFKKLVASIRGHVGKKENRETYKESGMAVAMGVGANVLHSKVFTQVEFMQEHWWAEPAALAVGGHFVARKNKAAGHGLLGVAGYLLAEGWMADQAQQGASASANTGATKTSMTIRNNARGLEDAGDDASALVNSAFTALPAGDSAAYVDVSGLRDTGETSDVVRTRGEARGYDDDSGDASDAMDL